MSNKNLIVNTPEPKPGILERGDLFAIAIGMVIGSGMVTLIGPAMAMTGYSVWLAYLTAIVMGFFMVFPYIILGGTMRVAGGPYSIVTNLSGVSAGGLVAYTKLVTPILNSSFALALGLYVNNLLPGITVKAIAVVGICILFVLNLLGMDIFAKVSKILSTILLITMVLYVVFGLTQIKQPIFQFSGDKMFTGGFKGFMLAALLLINSANGYYNILWYGKDAKKATKDVPFASMACVPCLLFIYVGLAMVTGGVLPHDEVAGAPTILPAAQAILPGAVYKIFMIGGPIMAIITTLNSVFNDVRYPLAQAAKDGWLPKFILKENRFGAPYLIYTYTLIVVLIPIVTDMSIVTITNIFQVITFFMNVTVVYAISRLPKRYPEAWAKNLGDENLGYDLKFDEEQRKQSAHMEIAMVRKEYRGQGLQRKMMEESEQILKEQGYHYLLGTAHPDNVASVNTFLKLQYEQVMTKEKYGGMKRSIFCKAI